MCFFRRVRSGGAYQTARASRHTARRARVLLAELRDAADVWVAGTAVIEQHAREELVDAGIIIAISNGLTFAGGERAAAMWFFDNAKDGLTF